MNIVILIVVAVYVAFAIYNTPIRNVNPYVEWRNKLKCVKCREKLTTDLDNKCIFCGEENVIKTPHFRRS